VKALRFTSSLGLLAFVVAGCAIGRAPQHFHLLNAAPAARIDLATTAVGPGILVVPTTAAPFYDAQAIVYSRASGTRSYYQLNSWTEPPSRRVGALLTERLADSGAFGSVATVADGVDGRLLLSTNLEEMYHDARTGPGVARIALTATLTDPARRAVIAQRRFTSSQPAATEDAVGAVGAFDAALAPLLDEVVQWVAHSTTQVHASR